MKITYLNKAGIYKIISSNKNQIFYFFYFQKLCSWKKQSKFRSYNKIKNYEQKTCKN